MRFTFPKLPFMRYSRHGLLFSLVLSILSIVLITFRGFNFGLEFTGGATLELQFAQAVNIAEVREEIAGIHDKANVIQYGSAHDVQISFGEVQGKSTDAMMAEMLGTLKGKYPEVKLIGQAKVGGQYREELIEKGITALLLSCIGMIVYLSMRFEWKFAIGAVAAQMHDVLVVAALFSLMQWTFDLNVLAALLAVLGYSVNDTVVLYDRIRENLKKLPAQTPEEVIDISIQQTMMRTFVTSLTTMLSVFALLCLGGETLFGFAAAMIVGIVFGTYSSIFVATAIVKTMQLKHEDLLPKARRQIDDLP